MRRNCASQLVTAAVLAALFSLTSSSKSKCRCQQPEAAFGAAVQQSKLPLSCAKEGEIALTFDGGPSYYTGTLLNALGRENVKAAFHVTSDYFDNPVIMAYLRRAVADGHLIGLHVTALPSAGSSPEAVAAGVAHVKKLAMRTARHTGVTSRFVRFTAPLPAKELLLELRKSGFVVTFYNLDSTDYAFKYDGNELAGQRVFEVFRNTLDSIVAPARGSFIAVQRDLLSYSVAAVENVVRYAKRKGYTFVRLDACIRASNGADKRPPASDFDVSERDVANFAAPCFRRPQKTFLLAVGVLLANLLLV